MDDGKAIESTDSTGPLDMTKMSRRSSSELSSNCLYSTGDSRATIVSINSQISAKSRSPAQRGAPIKRKATSPKSLSSKDLTNHESCRPEKMAALNGIDEITPTSEYTLKEEEEEDDDDEEEVDNKSSDKIDANNFDPERLKAFNVSFSPFFCFNT